VAEAMSINPEASGQPVPDSLAEKAKLLSREFSLRPEEKDYLRWIAKDVAVLEYFAGLPERVPREMWTILETLRTAKGADLYIELVYALTHKFFPAEDARVLWDLIIQHRKKLTSKLNRAVSIKVAVVDYQDQHASRIQDLQLFPEEDVDRLFLFANEDGLTGLYNHRYFQERLHYEVSRSRRYRHAFSLLIIDVDNFKHYNDTYGHLKGDILLRDISDFFKAHCREADVVARYGGDEFAFILPETGAPNALLAAKRLHQAYQSRPFGSELDQAAPVTISIGVGTFPRGAEDAESLIEVTDRALYSAKRAGRNRIGQADTKAAKSRPKK
jgi:diguanylate cyclase (GGDEF)-like protein